MPQERSSGILVLLVLLAASLSGVAAQAFDPYLSPRLGLSLATLGNALEKVAGLPGGQTGPVVFASRPGSQQGTQEARLPGNAGIVQAGGDTENLAAVVLWLPVDAQGKLAGSKARPYLNAFVELFTRDSEPVVRWVEQVLERAVADPGSVPHLESQLFAAYQFKATYLRTLSPAMCSLTVIAAEE